VTPTVALWVCGSIFTVTARLRPNSESASAPVLATPADSLSKKVYTPWASKSCCQAVIRPFSFSTWPGAAPMSKLSALALPPSRQRIRPLWRSTL
jgi:hypothetical protein